MSLSTATIAEFAAQFIDNLEAHGNRQFLHAAFVVADLDDEGDVRILLQATDDNHLATIKVFQAAQIQQTLALAQRQQFFEDDE
jgi:hypothetical protein